MKNLFLVFILLFSSFQLIGQAEMEVDSQSPWQVRLRGISVTPAESATIEVIEGDVEISSALVPELDFTYFFTENISAELILATTKHDVDAVTTAVGDINLGEVWLLPPTLTLQYHFGLGSFKPYLGAGVNYTIFYGVESGEVADDVSYENTVGFAGQLGFDYMLNDNWFINVDVKKLVLGTDVTVDATSALEAVVGADVDINPLILGAGIGFRF